MFAGMKMILTPENDSVQSQSPTEANSGVAFTAKRTFDGGYTISVTLTLLDGRALTFCADELGATLRALGVL